MSASALELSGGEKLEAQLEGGKPRCLFQLETRWLMVTAESCEQSGARACSIKNNDLLTSGGRKWQHVPDHLTQLGREA